MDPRNADAAALEARKAADADDHAKQQPAPAAPPAAVASLTARRLAQLPPDTGRCPPSPPTTNCCAITATPPKGPGHERQAPPRADGARAGLPDAATATIRAQFPDLAEAAAREQMSYRGFLAELLMAECDDRARRRSERWIKAAGFPREKSLRTFDFDANPSVDPAVIHTLATCDWVKKGLPLCLIGDSGTGKSHS